MELLACNYSINFRDLLFIIEEWATNSVVKCRLIINCKVAAYPVKDCQEIGRDTTLVNFTFLKFSI